MDFLSCRCSLSMSAVFCLAFFSACLGSMRPGSKNGPKSEAEFREGRRPLVPMEPTQIVGRLGTEGSTGDVFTETELFERGLDAFRRKDWERAIREFERLVVFFPQSLNVPPALFNIGVIHEKNRKYKKAEHHYKRYLKEKVSQKDRIEALFRLAWVFFNQRKHEKTIETLEKMDSEEAVSTERRIEGDILRGRALTKKGRLDSAEQVLASSLRLFHLYESVESSLQKELGARLAYYLARIPHKRMNETKLTLPAESMSRSLALKGEFFKKARNGYFQVLRYGCPGWSSLGLREVIQLLEDFVWSVVNAPVPNFENVRFFDGKTKKWKTISSERLREAYIENVRNRLRYVLLGAMESYKTNEAGTIGMGLDDFWQKDAQKLLSRLRALLNMLPSLRFGGDDPEVEQRRDRKGEDLFDWGVEPSNAEDFHPFSIPFQ